MSRPVGTLNKNHSKYYINDDQLVYEIILSKGKGYLTADAVVMLINIGKNFMNKKKGFYRSEDDMDDCHQQGMLALLTRWDRFNEKKYHKALPYFSEVFKRGMAEGFNDITGSKGPAMVSLNWYMENNQDV